MNVERCGRSIAYLKPDLSGDPAPPDFLLEGEDQPILRAVGLGLLATYLVDEGDHFRYIQVRDCVREEFTVDRLHRAGVSNLEALVFPQLEIRETRGIYAALADGNFEASLYLCDRFWSEIVPEYCAEPCAVVVPARDVLVFGAADDASTIRELHDVVARVWPGGDHLISTTIFRRQDGEWSALQETAG